MPSLKDWIKEQMTVDVENELSKYKEQVRDLIQLTPNGDIILKQTDLTAKQKIVIYLIGKVYSKAAEYSKTETATNKEFTETLGLPEGTVKFTLFDLRKEGLAYSLENGVNQIRIASIGLALDRYFGGEKQSE